MKKNTASKVYIKLTEFCFRCLKPDVNSSIVKTLLERIGEFPDIYIEEVAYAARTTPASVTKFCKALGYDSFKAMRTDLQNYSDSRFLETAGEQQNADELLKQFLQKEHEIEQFIFDSFDRGQIERISSRFHPQKRIAIVGNPYSFSTVNFFREVLSQEGYLAFEINRQADETIIRQMTNETDIVFVISLTGEWVQQNKALLKDGTAKKIMLTQYPFYDHEGIADEVVSFEKIDFLLHSNYYSQKVIQGWIVLLMIYIKSKKK